MPANFFDLLEQACKSTRLELEGGRALFRQGDSVRWLFVVGSGRLRLSRVSAKGSEIALARIGSAQVLAEASLFASHYHCDAIAETRCLLRRYPVREVRALLEGDSHAAVAYSAYLAWQLMDLRAIVEIRGIRRADEK